MNTRFLSILFALCGTGLAGSSAAQIISGPAVGFQQCFYECKLDPSGANRYVEITSLMIANGRQPRPGEVDPITHAAELVILDGNERIRLVTSTLLSTRDLDEINICATIDAGNPAGVATPSAGNIQVLIYDVTPQPTNVDPVDIWMKNVIGRMNRLDPEPFNGRVTGVGKVACEPIEDQPGLMFEDPNYQRAPRVEAVLIENTKDEPTVPRPDLTIRLINPPTTVSCPGGAGTCVHQVDFEVRELNGVSVPGNFTVDVFDDSQGLSTSINVPGIIGGTAAGFSVILGPGGNCYDPNCGITAEVDSSSNVVESDETNNTDSRLDLG